MAGMDTLISSLLSMASKLLPEVKNSVFAPSSSSSAQSPNASVLEDDLNELMRILNKIKTTLHDAEEREIRDDCTVKHRLKEIKEVCHETKYVLDEYMYEVHRALVKARNASHESNPRKRKTDDESGTSSCLVTVPDRFVDRIKEIRSKFDEIEKGWEALCLHDEDGPRRHKDVRSRAPSTHMILESNVYGRDKDKEDVIDLLFSNIDEGIVKVVPIVGKGGLGKTTLAQLVCNDKRVKQKFDLFGWVCVSGVFDVERLMRELVESLTRTSCSLKRRGPLQEKLKEEVVGKNVFVVLDDVWNEDENLWNFLRTSFMSALGASFIVTTRSDRVAKIMQTTFPFRLGCLAEHDSWSLFQHYAFGGDDHNVHPNLLDLGRLITKKCDGLPLAVKSISSLLRYELEDEETWVDILENDLWEIYAGNEIYGALQISYSHMPTYLRPCYLYCSLFPKDHGYFIDELIELWITEGYIQSDGNGSLEEIAFGYALELRERSFFDSSAHVKRWDTFKIHDMVHDLARMNSQNEFYSIGKGKQPNSGEVIHIYLDGSEDLLKNLTPNSVGKLQTIISKSSMENIDLSNVERLRTLKFHKHILRGDAYFLNDHDEYKPIVARNPSPSYENSSKTLKMHDKLEQYEIDFSFPKQKNEKNELGFSFPNKKTEQNELDFSSPEQKREHVELDFSFTKHLRFLELICPIDWPISFDSLFSLYHLERLNLNLNNNLMELEALRNLINLQYLTLSKCNVEKFLESLCFLRHLKLLNLQNCPSVGLPKNIGEVAHLEKLVIHGCGVSKTLDMLPESLSNLSNLVTLSLTKCRGFMKMPNDLGNLTNLQSLIIKDTGISYLPDNINNLNRCQKFDVSIRPVRKGLHDTIAWLKGLDNFKGTLAILQLGGLHSLENARNFNLMKKLHIKKLLLSWADFFPSVDKNRLEIFINRFSLTSIKNMNLHVLEALQPHPNLEHLGISHYENPVFPRWMGDPLSCASLKTLCIDTCENISLPFGNLASLEHLKIKCCDNLQTISRESLPVRLRVLKIHFCRWLRSVMGVGDLESLVELKIDRCQRLTDFPFKLISEGPGFNFSSSGLKNLNPLKKLKMGLCPNLKLAESEVFPSVNCKVEIYNCLGLEEWCLRHNISYTTKHDFDKLSDSSDEYSSSDESSDDLEQDILKNMEQGNSFIDVMDEDMEKGSSSVDVMDED